MADNLFEKYRAPEAAAGNQFTKYAPASPAPAADAPKPKLTRSWGEAATDTAKGVGAGFGSLLQAGGDLYGLATGDFDNVASREGRGMRKFYEDSQSEALQEKRLDRSAAIDQADGILGKAGTAIKETLTDPALIGDVVASNIPSLIPAAGVGRAVGAVTGGRALLKGATQAAAGRAAARAGTAGAIGTGAVQQGADVAGGVYDRGVATDEATLAANPEYQERIAAGEDPDTVRHELALSAARGAFPAATAISALSQAIPGGATLERALVGGAARATLRNPGLAGKAYGVARGALGEGAQEAVEEGGGQFAGNVASQAYVDPNQDLSEDVGENAGMGFAGAIGLGGVAGGAHTQRGAEPAPPPAKPGSLTDVANAVAAAAPQPVLALPAPTMIGRSDGRVATEAQAFASNQKRQERQVALASERAGLGLTPDVNAARAQHPGAVPNEQRRATLQQPQPQKPAAAPKVDDGGFRRALAEQQAPAGSLTDTASATPAPTLTQPAAIPESGEREPYERRALVGVEHPPGGDGLLAIDDQGPANPPSNLDPETGEILGIDAPSWPNAAEHQQPQAIIASLTAEGMRRKGRPPGVTRISETYNIDMATARALRNQVVKSMTAASLPPVSEPDASAEPASSASAELEQLAAADAAPAALAALDPAQADREEAAGGEEAGASASPPVEVRAQDTPLPDEPAVYDETDELLDADIGAPSGRPFTIAYAAQRVAARTEGGRVFPVDGGFVVRTPGTSRQGQDESSAPEPTTAAPVRALPGSNPETAEAAPARKNADPLPSEAQQKSPVGESPVGESPVGESPAPAAVAPVSTTGDSAVRSPPDSLASQPGSDAGPGTIPSPQATPAPGAVQPKTRVKQGKRSYVEGAPETLQAYFQPGRIINGYGGPDRVIAFNPPKDGQPWSVRVIRVDKDGNPAKDEVARTHSTLPEQRELVKVLGKAEKPVPKRQRKVAQSAAPAGEVGQPIAKPAEQRGNAAGESGPDSEASTSKPAQKPETPRQIRALLKSRGEQVRSDVDAERRWNAGDRLFGIHDMDDGGDVHEIGSYEELHNFTPDQLMAVSRTDSEAVATERRARAAGNEAAAPLEEAAHAAATSSKNGLPDPTEAQREAGNYKKGHARIGGLDISIENPRGSRRRPEWPPLAHHYGYFRGTIGNDKDHVDVFLTDNAADPDRPVFVVDQVNKDGSFDEHKVVMGAANEAEARKAYLDNYTKGWTGLGAITQMSLADFKAWVMDPAKTRRPLGKLASAKPSPEKTAITPGVIADKIEDFGEKIHGARKDYAASYGERIKDALTLDVARHPLSKTWPEPDYAKLVEEGTNSRVVAFVHAARDQVPTKPTSSWKLRRYVETVTSLRETANKLLSGEIPADRIMYALDKDQSRAALEIMGRMKLYDAVGHERSLKGMRIGVGEYSLYNGQKFNPPKVIWTVEVKVKATAMSNWPRILGEGNTEEAAIAAFKKYLATAEDSAAAAKGPTRFDIYSRPRHPGFFIGKKLGRQHYDLEHFEDVKAARLYLAEHQAELEAKLAKIKNIPAHRRERNSPRVGVDHRGGADVSPEQFSEAFGFRGVQFGNYVEGPRRQRDLNQAYDSLMDLAGVLDVPARALSLNGSLGLAFGARGKGGARPAAAHFEPTHVVINLTKGAGAGSLAHEWWHGLDNYFSRQRSRSMEFVSGSLTGKNEGLRPEMLRAFTRVMNTIHESGLKSRSKKLDQRRSKAYWSTDLEMSARAFENYVIAKLADAGQSNDYLANIVSESSFGLTEEYPYLSAEEVPAVRAAYDDFFSTVEREETPEGNVRLFSKAADDVVPVVAAQKSSEPAETMWRAADEFYRSNLQGKTFEGPDGPVRFSGASRKKALAQGRRDPIRLGVAQQLGEIARVAPVYEEIEDRAGDRHLKYAYAVAPVDIGGERFTVKMVYRRSKGDAPGRSFYTFEGYEISEPGAMIRGRSPEGELGAQGSPGSGESVADLVAAINSGSRRFALGAGTGGLAFDRAVVLKAQITGKWGQNAPQVVLVENAEGFPDSAKVDPQYRRGEGFYNGKPTIWINVGNIRTEKRFAEVMAHEGLGHFGVERVVGRDQWAGIVAAVEKLERKGAVNPKIAAVLKDVRQRYGDVDRETYAKEVIAVLAERGIRNSWVDKVVAAVRRWLRANMPGFGWAEKDVLGLLSQAESFLRAGTSQAESRQQVGALAFSLGQRARMRVDAAGQRSLEFGGETFVDRSGKFYLVNGDGKPKDFTSLGAATEASQRTGAELLVNPPSEGERPSWAVVAPDVAVRGAELPGGRTPGQGLFSMAPADVLDEIDAVMADGDKATLLERARAALKNLVPKKVKDQLRPTWLGALATRHLTELGSDYFGNIKHYSDFLAEQGADRNKLQAEAEEVAEGARKWAGKHRTEAQVLFDLMHEATIDGVDPAEDYQALQFRYGGQLREVTPKSIKEALKAIREQMRGRGGDNKTDMIAEAKMLRGMPARERRRREKYGPLVERWNRLSPQAQEIYRQFRDMYEDRSKQVEEGLVARINDTDVPENHKRKLINTIRMQFETQRLQGVYFPLQRFGQYFVAAEKGDTPTFLMFENLNQMERGVKGLRQRGFTIKAQGLKSAGKAKDAPSGTFVAEVIETMRKAGVSDKTQDEIYQIYLASLPELSMRKHAIHRQAVPGFDPDAIRGFAFNMHHGAHQLARLRYSHKLQNVLDLLRQQQDASRKEEGADTRKIVAGDAILEELGRRHEWINNPQDSNVTNLVSSFGFSYYLGATPAAALVNLTQTAMVTYPYLASRFGGVKAMNHLLAGMRDAVRTRGNIQKTLTDPEELRAHSALQAMGALDKTQAHNLAGIAEGGLSGYNPAWAKAMEIIGWGFHKTEVVNREASGMAAFRLARAEGQSFGEAVKFAADTINDTHFDYTNANRARFMQSGTAKVLLMFRQYSLNMTWHLGRMVWLASKGQTPEVKRIARRNLAGLLGMSALFSGTLGLPMMGVTMGVLNAIASSFGDDDEPWEAETEFRAFLKDMLGDTAAETLLNGVANQVTGADVAGRVSLSDLWIRDADRELDGRGKYYHLLEQAAGPMGGVLKNALVGKQLMDEGHLVRGVETVLPKSLKDMIKASRYATQGVNNLRGDPILENPSLYQALLQLNGFSPSQVAERYDANRALKNYEQAILDRRQHLMDAFAMAHRLGDADGMAKTREKIGEFNGKNPEIAITGKSILASLKSRARYSKRAEGGIVLNAKIAARVRERVGVE